MQYKDDVQRQRDTRVLEMRQCSRKRESDQEMKCKMCHSELVFETYLMNRLIYKCPNDSCDLQNVLVLL